MKRNNKYVNMVIERFIDQYEGTCISSDVRNMYENESSYESILERMDLDYSDYAQYEG